MDSINNRLENQGITRVVSFTSGKGGVGKTHTVVNTAITLASQGFSVLVLDADLGLANVDVLLGIQPKGIAHRFDFLLIDTPAGIGSDVMYFNSAAAEIVCVITGEPTSLTDSYALIKVLSAGYGEKAVSVVVNNVATESDARAAFNTLSNAVTKFLQVDTRYVGWIPSDEVVRQCIMERRPIAAEFPSSRAARGIADVARRLGETSRQNRVKGGMQFFFRQLLDLSMYGKEASY